MKKIYQSVSLLLFGVLGACDYAPPKTVFDQPIKKRNINLVRHLGERLTLLRETDTDRTPLAINLATREMMNLPDNLIRSSTQDILAWMRGQ